MSLALDFIALDFIALSFHALDFILFSKPIEYNRTEDIHCQLSCLAEFFF